jgi:hypothetical protein
MGDDIPELQELQIRHQNRMAEIARQGQNSLATTAARGEETRKSINERANVAAAKGETPAQTKIRQYNKAREVLSKNPAYSQFITITGPNDFLVKADGSVESNEIIRKIYGEEPDIELNGVPSVNPDAPKGNTPPKAAAPKVNTKTADRVTVTKDGKNYLLPKSQLEEAKRQGYTEVK